MPSARKRAAVIAGMAVSAIFLYLALRGLRPEQLWESLDTLNAPTLLLAMLVYAAAVIVISLRWQFLLRAVKRVPLRGLTPLVFIGYMGNNLYPFRAGDALRVLLLRREQNVPLLRSTTIVALERVFDGCVMLSFVLLGLLRLNIESSELDAILAFTAPLFALALAVAFAIALKPGLLRALLSLAQKPLPNPLGRRLGDFGDEVSAGLESLRSPSDLLGAVVSSYATWSIEALTYWIVMDAFGLQLPYAAAMLLVGAVNLAGLIPASPGQIGVSEFVVITILTGLGIATPDATAYAIVVHLSYWLPITIGGFLLLLKRGLGWADIRRASELDGAPG